MDYGQGIDELLQMEIVFKDDTANVIQRAVVTSLATLIHPRMKGFVTVMAYGCRPGAVGDYRRLV